MKVIFMGTPEFSCPTLQLLIETKDVELVAVYTREPARSGRGKKIQNSPIHNLALKHNIKVVTPKTLKDDQEQEQFLNFNCDLAVVVAYGLILPKKIINGPKFGCINLHPSYLPKFRGAAPIQRTIMSSDKETATTIIKMDENLDSGDVIAQEVFALDNKINYIDLANKFADDGARLILETIKNFKLGKVKYLRQNDNLASYAKKVDKSEALLDFALSAEEVNRKIRAFSGNIGAYFLMNNERLKVFAADIIDCNQENKDFGQINKKNMHINCKKGIIQPKILQKPGKSKVTLDEFLTQIRQ
jgi:methionyl-tRNA formyltransferase